LKPLTEEETMAYIAHRLAVANGSRTVTFLPRAVQRIHRYSGGIPRLINLLCDRALLGSYSAQSARVTPALVEVAAEGLDLKPAADPSTWFGRMRRVMSS
jgi:general secretion pathway protein A